MPRSKDQAVIVVDAKAVVGPVNRRVLGTNALADIHSQPIYSAQGSGMWDPEKRQSVTEMTRLARDVGVATLRWPGGCGVHEYNWKLTVGPVKDRPKQPFGLPEFMQVCRDIGAQPMITIADFWGDAADAADLVEYLNASVDDQKTGREFRIE